MKRCGVWLAVALAAGCTGGTPELHGDGGAFAPIDDPVFFHDDSPSTPSPVGATCDDCKGKNLDCIDESAGFAGGYCTQECSNTSLCPAGSICAGWYAGIASSHRCYRTCSPLDECRVGYECIANEWGLPICYPGYVPPRPPLPSETAACANVTGEQGSVPSAPLSDVLAYGSSVAVAVDPASNRAIVAWASYETYRNMGLRIALSPDGGASFPSSYASWADNQWAYMNHPLPTGVAAAVDDTGRFWVATTGKGLALYGSPWAGSYEMRTSTDGATWNEIAIAKKPTPEVDGGKITAPMSLGSLALAVHPTTRAPWVAWVDGIPGHSIVLGRNTNFQTALADTTGMGWIDGDQVVVARRPVGAVRVDHPVLAFAPDGTAAIAWVVIRGDSLGATDNELWVQRLDSGGANVGAAVRVTSGADSPVRDRPSLAFVGDSLVVAFTSGTPSGDWQIRVATSFAGAAFLPSVRIDSATSCSLALHPTLTVSPTQTYVTYYRAIGNDGSVYRTTLAADNATGAFASSTTKRLATSFSLQLHGGGEISPRLGVVAANGRLFSAWTQTEAPNPNATVRVAVESE